MGIFVTIVVGSITIAAAIIAVSTVIAQREIIKVYEKMYKEFSEDEEA